MIFIKCAGVYTFLSLCIDCWGSGPTAMGLGPLEMHCHEVPAFEVFADRQPVEWGLTEVIEHSLVSQDGPDPIRPRRHRMAMDGLTAGLLPWGTSHTQARRYQKWRRRQFLTIFDGVKVHFKSNESLGKNDETLWGGRFLNLNPNPLQNPQTTTAELTHD